MSKVFFRRTQLFIFLNLIIQLFWVSHINFPTTIRLNWNQLKITIIAVGLIYLLSGIFVGIYLFKNKFKFSFASLIAEAIYYLFILYYWYRLVDFKIELASYKLAFFGFLATSFLFGISLIVSKTRQKKWIKRAGVIISIILLGHITLEFFNNYGGIFEIIHIVLGYAGSITSIFWLLNFQNEINSLPIENDSLIDSPQ